jgi:1,2-diacylglycerol 3-alpha-glucosyltransferase
MTRKIVIVTEIIAPYRIPVFNALADHADIELHAIFLAETDKSLRQWPVYSDEIRFSHEVLPSWRWRAGKHGVLVNRGLRSALDAANPSAIICGGYNHPAFWQALRWARRHRHEVRFVLWTESNQQDARSGRRSVEWLKRCFVRSCDGFVVPGKSSAAYLRTLGVSESAIFKAPNAVDNAFFAKNAENARTHATEIRKKLNLPLRFILFVGRLVPEKGIFDLLDAYAKLEPGLRSEVGLVYAGDGSARAELMRRAAQVSPGTISFSGFAHREDLAALYALAEGLILPTHSDPWGLVVNEAMACGLPIIASSVAGCAADLVEDGWNGYVVLPRDSEKIKSAITVLIGQPDVKQQMSTNSLEKIRHYSPEACALGLRAAAVPTDVGAR